MGINAPDPARAPGPNRQPFVTAGDRAAVAAASFWGRQPPENHLNYNSCHPPLIRIMMHEYSHWAEGSKREPAVRACCRPAISRTKHVTYKRRCPKTER